MRRCPPFLIASLVLASRALAQDVADSDLAASPAANAFVATYCVDCHGGDTTKGKLDLLRSTTDPVERLALWSRLRERVRTGEMPPPDAEMPAPSERTGFAAWVDGMLASEVPKLAVDPGRSTVRRLSRTQWQNVVRDLFAVTVSTTAFPVDDLGYGFDTVGDALSFSTLHLEKYLAAAREVSFAVFDGEESGRPRVRRFEAETMQLVDGPGAGMDGDVANLYTRATIEQVVRLPRDGVYRLTLLAGADQAGDEPAKMVLRLDDRDLDTFEVETRQPREFSLVAPLPAGAHRFAIAFTNDFYDPKNEDPTRRDRNLRIDWLEVQGPTDERPPPAAREWLQPALAGLGTDDQKLRAVVRALLPRVYRRPVGDDEVARVRRVGEDVLRSGQPLSAALRAVLQAALVSPHFLFRIESGGVVGKVGSVIAVPGPVLAQRLSFFLWGSAPDESLRTLGQQGKLADAGVLAAEVARLLADPRADSLAVDFAAMWLELRSLADRTPDPTRFPGFDDTLRRSLQRETELLFLAVLREGRDVRELLDCDFTHVDAVLAGFYGFERAADAVGFQRIQLPASQRERGGVLGHASFLAVTSNPTRTSPVKRGKWILENLLGQPPPPPPPGNDTLANEAAIDSSRTFREQLAQHRSRPQCMTCHVRMDTLGFALERYDPIGRYRETDAGGEIDSSGELPGGVRIDGLAALKRVLHDDPAFVRTVAQKLFVYAIGRDLRPVDRLRIDHRVAELLARGRVTLADLVLLVVQDDAFGKRVVVSAK